MPRRSAKRFTLTPSRLSALAELAKEHPEIPAVDLARRTLRRWAALATPPDRFSERHLLAAEKVIQVARNESS